MRGRGRGGRASASRYTAASRCAARAAGSALADTSDERIRACRPRRRHGAANRGSALSLLHESSFAWPHHKAPPQHEGHCAAQDSNIWTTLWMLRWMLRSMTLWMLRWILRSMTQWMLHSAGFESEAQKLFAWKLSKCRRAPASMSMSGLQHFDGPYTGWHAGFATRGRCVAKHAVSNAAAKRTITAPIREAVARGNGFVRQQ